MESKGIIYLDEDLMCKMCHRLAVEFFDSIKEPIAKFEEHEHELLNSALNLPRQTFAQKDLYPTLSKKAAVLYYSLNKNHPFKNGNKRIATASLVVFLFINGYALSVGQEDLFQKTLFVAQSFPHEREDILMEIEKWIQSNIKPLK